MSWKLPNGKTISFPKNVRIEDTNYPRSIFLRWSKEELNNLGIYPFREEGYDGEYYRSTAHIDIITDGECVRTHSKEKRYTNQELMTRIAKHLKSTLKQYRNYVKLELDYLNVFEPNNTAEIDKWLQYTTDLKAAALVIKSDIQALASYAEAVNYIRSGWQPKLPAIPDEETV